MTHTIRLATLAGLMVGGFGLATLSPAASNEANAQLVIRLGGTSNNVPQTYYRGYGTGYRTGIGNGYVWQAARSYGYTGYGVGSYGYGSSIRQSYGYPYSGYGYGSGIGTTHSLHYRGSRSLGRSYSPVYNSNYGRFYSPYGRRGF